MTWIGDSAEALAGWEAADGTTFMPRVRITYNVRVLYGLTDSSYCRTHTIKCELDSLHASEAWDEGLEWESYQFGRTVFSTSAGIEHELE